MPTGSTVQDRSHQATEEKFIDPIVFLAQTIGRRIGAGEEVSIPPELRGIDPHTGRTRTQYAAKARLKHTTQRMFAG